MAKIINLFQVSHAKRPHRELMLITHCGKTQPRLSEDARHKYTNQSWQDFAYKLWVDCWQLNGRDDIELTVHLKPSQAHAFKYEFDQWYHGACMVDCGALAELARQYKEKMLFAGITFAIDIPE